MVQLVSGNKLSRRRTVIHVRAQYCVQQQQQQHGAQQQMRAVSRCQLTQEADMELGHWVTGSMGHLGHLSRPGHRVIILTRCETRVFPVLEKMPKMQNVHLKC